MRYEFAGLIIDIAFRYDFGKQLCQNYLYEGDKPTDFSVEITQQMIEKERQFDMYESEDAYLEAVAAYREICYRAYAYDCMFIHCSAIAYKGNAILFTAPSGTGKSTHSYLWRRHFGEDVTMINDDKPLLRFKDNQIFACGTPWDGKHHLSNNVMLPVKAVVLLSQSSANQIEKMDKKDLMYHLLNQTIRPENPALMNQVLTFCEAIVKNVPAYRLGCTISDEAVTTCFDAIKENFDED